MAGGVDGGRDMEAPPSPPKPASKLNPEGLRVTVREECHSGEGDETGGKGATERDGGGGRDPMKVDSSGKPWSKDDIGLEKGLVEEGKRNTKNLRSMAKPVQSDNNGGKGSTGRARGGGKGSRGAAEDEGVAAAAP